MKNIIGRIAGGGAKIATYLSIAVKSRLAVAALAALAAGGAWAVAPTPTVVWDGDFSSLTKTVGDVTYTIGNVTGSGVSTTTANSVGGDKSYLQIANSENGVAAPIITATGSDSAFGNATDGATVLIFASGMPLTEGSNRALLLLMDNTGKYGRTVSGTTPTAYSRFGIARARGNNYGGAAAGGFVLDGSINTVAAPVNLEAYTDGKQSIALTYKGSSGLKYYVDGALKGEYNPDTNFTPTGVCIGGVDYTSSNWFFAQNRMKIHAIAIFNRELTAEEIAEYEAQSRFRYCDAIAWRNAGGGSTQFHVSTFASVGSIGEVANSATRAYDTTGEFPWQVSFSTGKLPVALVYDQADKQQSTDCTFGPIWIGGMYVNAVPSSEHYTLGQGSNPGARTTYLGDKTGNHESWFVFNESYTINRAGNNSTTDTLLYGTVNMYIEADKTFTLNSGASTSAKNLVMTAGTANTADPVFRMSGEGKLVVPHLNASVGTLDFSGVTAAPFIQGDLTVTAATKLVLPSGLAAETAYQICSGVLTAPTVVQGATVRIGDDEEQEVILMYDTTAKTVKYYTSFPEYNGTVSGTTITWDTEPTSEQMALGIVNLTGSGEVTLAVQPVAVNAGSGVTVDVTGYTTAGLSGAGTFKYTSGYPTTVPEGVTYEYVGGTEESPCASSDKYTVNGTLKLNGYFTLSGANTVPNASGVLEIASGKSTVTFGSNTAGVTGWIQIDSGAELVAASNDALNYDRNSGGIKVSGKLSLGSCRWSFNTNNKFYLYNGGEVSGEGDSTHHCALDFYQSNRILVFGTCTISANVRTRDSDDLLTIAQARDSNLTISGNIIGAGKVKKDYATTDEGNAQANAGNSTTYFSGANTFGGAFTAANNTGYITMRPGVSFNSATAFTIGTGNELDFGMSDGTDSASAIEFNNTVSNSGATKVYCKLTLRSGANATTWGDNFTGTVQVQSTGGLVVPATCTGESSTCNFSIVNGGKLYGGGTVVLNAFPTLTTSVLDSGWTGKVVFPVITSGGADNGFNQKVNAFGNTASTVKLLGLPTSGDSTYFTDNGSVNTTLELAEGCTLRINNGYSAVSPGKTGTIYNLTGAGTLLHAWSPSPSDKMFKISVTTVSNFTGSVQNTSSVTGCDINIGKLHFDSKPVGGARVLSATASDTGKITVGGTNINGLILVQKSDGFYSAAASYNGENHATIEDAIDAAGDENLGDIVVADPSAAVPEGYAIVGGTRLRKGGETIYWTSGTYWAESGGSAVFLTALSDGEATTYAAGDTVVIPDNTKRWYGQISDGAKIVFSCGGTIDVDKTGDLGYAFKNAEITIESGTTVNFVQDGYGTDPEVNGGSISGEGAITVANGATLVLSGEVEVNGGSISGQGAITVANGATLVLSGEVELGITPSGGTVNVASGAEVSCTGSATISSTLAGSGEVSFATLPASELTLGAWTGTVELPVLAANQAYRLNYYGKTGSTIRLNGLSAGWLAVAAVNVEANLELAGDWNLTAMSPLTYNFATVSGTGNMSFAPTGDQPTSINIATLSGYTGTITNNTTATLAIGTLALDSGADVSAGAKLLSTGGTGSFSVTAVTVGGEAQTLNLSYRSDGVYVRGVASYGNVEYETIAEAIAAAVEDGHTYEDVTILDATAACPAGYYVDTGDNDALKMYQAALVDTDGEKHYFYTPQAAVDAIAQYLGVAGAKTYAYYEVYYGENVAIAIDTSIAAHAAWAGVPLKIKCLAGASVAVTLASTESELTAGTPDENGIVTYTKTDKATTYVWAGATSYSATTAEKNYARADNWRVGTSSGATAARAPGSLDTVVFGNGAYASTTASQIVAALQVNGAVTIIGGGSLTSASAITLGTGDSITITGTLLPTPTTTVADSYVKETSSGSTTTYTVATQPTVSDVVFEYGDDFATATVTATVSDAAPSYKLTVGGTEYPGVVSDSTVTFSNVATGRTAAYDDVSYEIAATSGSTAVPLAGDTSGSAVVADSTAWIAENETNTGKAADAGGSWTTDVTYTEGKASVADNTFTATEPSTGDRVVLKFDDVVYPALSDMTTEISAGAQGAFSVGEVLENDVVVSTNFYILAREGSACVWKATTIAAQLNAEYDIVMTIDYATKKYSVSANGTALTVGGSTSFALCADNKSSVSEIEFKGSGTLSSINGETSVGYMVKDVSGSYYATIDDAIAEFNAAKGPYTVLHAAGTPPSGWQLVTEAGVTVLQKLAKLMIFMVK